MSTEFNYGIIPEYTFDDVSAQLVGEEVTLTAADFDNTATADLQFSLAASILNAAITDNADGTINASSPNVTTSNLARGGNFNSWVRDLVHHTYKGSIANYLTSYPNGDIGELENDTDLAAETLASDSILDAVFGTIVTQMTSNTDALRALAEEVIARFSVSGFSGADADSGRPSSAPFVSGDTLDFNMVLNPGAIQVIIDSQGTLETTSSGGQTIITHDPSIRTENANPGVGTISVYKWSTNRFGGSYTSKDATNYDGQVIVRFRINLTA